MRIVLWTCRTFLLALLNINADLVSLEILRITKTYDNVDSNTRTKIVLFLAQNVLCLLIFHANVELLTFAKS